MDEDHERVQAVPMEIVCESNLIEAWASFPFFDYPAALERERSALEKRLKINGKSDSSISGPLQEWRINPVVLTAGLKDLSK